METSDVYLASYVTNHCLVICESNVYVQLIARCFLMYIVKSININVLCILYLMYLTEYIFI